MLLRDTLLKDVCVSKKFSLKHKTTPTVTAKTSSVHMKQAAKSEQHAQALP
jgi:hypothetical protein